MYIYLDNNIIISIEEGDINLDVMELMQISDFEFVYSYIHILELLERVSGDKGKLRNQRYETIKTITNNNYIFPDSNTVSVMTEDPKKVEQTIIQNPYIFERFRQKVNLFNIDRNTLIEKLGIERKKINNYSPAEVVKYINQAFKLNFRTELLSYIDKAGNSRRDRINSLFNLLDFVGFWKDKENSRSNLARAYDASHAYFAGYCDYFVSNDKRARNKAIVVYSLLDINTNVVSFAEFLQNT